MDPTATKKATGTDQKTLELKHSSHQSVPKLIYRSMASSDLPSVLAIERESFTTPWNESTFRRAMNKENTYSHCLVAIFESKVVAYAHFVLIAGDVHITNLAVVQTHRRFGVGKSLLKKVLLQAIKMGGELCFLEVRVSNTAAYNLYQQFGFQIHSIRKRYYTDNGEDAYLLWIPDLSILRPS